MYSEYNVEDLQDDSTLCKCYGCGLKMYPSDFPSAMYSDDGHSIKLYCRECTLHNISELAD